MRRFVDTLVVLVPPGSGDTVQAMKAGILEVGDIYVVTHADRPSADQTAAELEATLALTAAGDWQAPVLLTAAPVGEGVSELSSAIDSHRHHLRRSSDEVERLAVDQARYDVEQLLQRRVRELIFETDPGACETTLAEFYGSVVHRLAAELPPIEDHDQSDQQDKESSP